MRYLLPMLLLAQDDRDLLKTINPTFNPELLPPQQLILDMAGTIQWTGLALAGICIVLGAVCWIWGKKGDSGRAQGWGVGFLVAGVIGAAIIGGAFIIPEWASRQPLIPSA